MRGTQLLLGGLVLLLPACSGGKSGHAPPPLKKELLAGKWNNSSDALFLLGYEFAEDGTAKATFKGMKQPVPARYTWTGDRTLELKYQAGPKVRQAYKQAARAYKDDLKAKVKAKKLSDKAGPSMAAAVQAELPAREEFRVAISEKPPRLILTEEESGAKHEFEQEDRPTAARPARPQRLNWPVVGVILGRSVFVPCFSVCY
jgi:hypothetical protein